MTRSVIAGSALALLVSCQPQQEAPPSEVDLETIDVGTGLDSAIRAEEDERAEARPRMAGALPGDFPDDLPVYVPSSLIDFGPGRVTLRTVRPLSAVQSQYSRELIAQGWQPKGNRYQKTGREVEVDYTADGPEILIQIEYWYK